MACATALAHAATAQNLTDPSDPPPPVYVEVDGNGVDLISGQFNMADAQAPIGGGSDALARDYYGLQSRDNFYGAINSSTTNNVTTYTVSIGSSTDSFTLSGSTFTSNTGDGATLVETNPYTYTYTGRDGSIATFSTAYAGTVPTQANVARIASVQRPDGLATTYTYQTYYRNGYDGYSITLLQSVSNNLGYQIEYEYLDEPTTAPLSTIRAIQGVNLAYNACNGSGNGCTGVNGPQVTFSGQVATDALGRNTTYGLPTPGTTMTITRPSGAAVSVTLNANGQVTQYATASGTWTYAYNGATTTVTDPNSNVRTVTLDPTGQHIATDKDALGNTTSYTYDSFGRETQVAYPEGNSVQYTYDARGNLTQTTRVAKPGSGLANITTSATFPATCSNPVNCNEPTATFDANGNETDYTYDPTHGGVLTVTRPAGPNGVRPQTRYSYTQLSAYYLQGGSSVAAGPPIYKLTGISTCATTASCIGTSDEIRTTIAYGATGSANNLQPTSVTKAAGDGSLSATTAISYSQNGDALTTTDADGNVTAYVYDADREKVGVIGPDPDGSGPLPNRATRISYNPDGQVSLTELGTVTSQSASSWANFSSILESANSYDSTQRLIQTTASPSGGAAQAVTQYSYDGANRLICTAVRMNAGAFSSLPASACTLGTAAGDGPDRIAHTSYDGDNRPLQVTSGYGTSAPRTEAVVTYTPNGNRSSFADGNGNLTSNAYDGFDRLITVNYPTPSSGSTSNASDYDQLTYDANSNVLTHRQRSGTVISYTYDALNRMSTGVSGTTYSYDNLGRLLSTSLNGSTVSYGYNALGRRISETGALGAMTSQYDANGNRTQLTWPDGFAVSYSYDATGAVTQIAEAGATSGPGILATYSYDSLGRRSAVSYGDGLSSSYGYDSISRLTSLSHAFPNSANNVSFSLAYNEASQTISRVTSNTTFDWNTSYAVNRPYTANGLNQLTTSGSLNLSYGSLGNLTSDGTNSFAYDLNSNLITANSNTLAYDPLNRLAKTVGSSTTQFLYDGANIVAEYDGSENLLRRYVDGPGTDQPIVWYQGTGTGTRQWMLADPRNSVIAVADVNGNLLNANTYDDYGVPGPSNSGRFQYTGQAWIPEAGVYDYKARTYSPTLGRFMQTDPLGYMGGLNWYAYAQNDPINMLDPNGTFSWSDVTDFFSNVGGFLSGLGADIGSFFGGGNPVTFSGSLPDGTLVATAPRCPGGYSCGDSTTLTSALTTQLTGISDFGPNGPPSSQGAAATQFQTFKAQLRSTACHLGPIGGNIGADAYAGLGTSVAGGISINPANGQIEIPFSIGAGVGGGLDGKFGPSYSRSSPSAADGVVTAGVNWNVGATAFGVGGSYSKQIFGSNPASDTTSIGPGGGLAAYANISAAGSFNLPPLYNLGC
jgi:RHS repeat-associated protein